MENSSEHLIIQKILSGDTNEFSRIVASYQNFVYTIVFRMVKNQEDAEDITQDVFIKIYNSLDSYLGSSKFSTWLYTIAYRKCLDHIKGNKNLKSIDSLESITYNSLISSQNALNNLEKEERSTLIKSTIQKLQPVVASIFTFYYFEELSIKEIATITGLSPDNVKIKLHRGRNKLYTILKKELIAESI